MSVYWYVYLCALSKGRPLPERSTDWSILSRQPMDPPKLSHLSSQKVKFPIYSFAFLNFPNFSKEAFEAG